MRIDAQCIAFPANSIVCRCFRAQTDAHVDVCYQMLVRGINLINNGISIEQLFTLSIVQGLSTLARNKIKGRRLYRDLRG